MLGRGFLLAGGRWSPARLGGAVAAWFDAQMPGTVSLSGSSVTSWASRVGSIVAAQATTANQPTYSATARNGFPGVTFNGSNHILDFSATTGFPSGDGDGFMCAVGYVAPTDTGYRYMASYGDAGIASDASRSIALGAAGGGKSPAFIVFGTSDDLYSTTIWSGYDRVFVSQAGSGQLSLTIDGQLSPDTKPATLVTTTPGVGRLGAYSGGGNYWKGVIQEVVVGNRKLTAQERQRMEGYLAWRWGLASQLPAGHPYRNAAP